MNIIELATAAAPQTGEITAVPLSELQTTATEAHTSEEATEGGVMGSLGINGQMLIFQFINFALVAAVLWFLILKPLTSKMTERQRIIDESLDNAKKVQENLSRSEKEYQVRIDEAKVEANKIIEKSQVEAERVSDEIKVRAKKEIEGLVLQAREKIQEEKREVMAGIKKETANLVVTAVEKILNEKMDEKRDKKIIEETLKDLNA